MAEGIDRTEKVGLGVALAGHAALFGLLSLGLLAAPDPKTLEEHPVEVSLVADVGPEQTAPPAPEPPSQSVAPDEGAPEGAAPPPPAAEPEPAPKPVPVPKPAPKPEPAPEPKPAPPKPVAQPAPKPAPAPKPVPVPKPKPKPVEPAVEKPAPKPAKVKPTADAAPAKPTKAAPTGGKPATGKPSTVMKPVTKPVTKRATTTATGSGEGKAARPKGSRLGSDFLKGLTDTPSKAPPSAAAPAAQIGAQALAGIGAAIKRQIQPCANRQVNPGPGAERIRVSINLKLNRDGSLGAPPRVVSHDGVDDDNRRYLDRVDDLGIATFTGCSPLTGLPADLYDVPHGWRSITLIYKLPG